MAKRPGDFKKETIDKGFFRTSFKCNKPSCRCSLIEQADNQKGYILLADACHICAASEGGPRYDPNMTNEERGSYDNLIIMCKTHAWEIDHDETKYPVELLKQWKKEAEEYADYERKQNNYFTKELLELEAELDILWNNCEIALLKEKLTQFNSSFGVEKEKLFLKYKILVDLFEKNESDNISRFYDLYLEYPSQMLDYLIEINSMGLLKQIKENTTDNYRDVITFLESNSIIELMKNQDFINKLKRIDENLCYKIMMNFMLQHNSLSYMIDDKNNEIPFYRETKYYDIIANALTIKKSYIMQPVKKLIDDAKESYFSLLTENKTINLLETNVQSKIYEILLKYLTVYNPDEFINFYNKIPEDIKEIPNIKNIQICYKLKLDINNIDIDKLIAQYSDTGNNLPLLVYMDSIGREDRKKIFDDYKFLIKKDVKFLFYYSELLSDEENKEILPKYFELYKDTFIYNCLCWKYSVNIKDSRDFCLKNEDEIDVIVLKVYVENLLLEENFETTKRIISKINFLSPKLSALFLMHHYLKDNHDYDDFLLENYKSIIENGEDVIGIRQNIGFILISQGKIEEANRYFIEEIEKYNSFEALKAFIHYRLENQIYIVDKYMDMCKDKNDFFLQWYVALCTFTNNRYDEALKYFTRCLLMNKNNRHACMMKIFEICHKINYPKQVEILKNSVVKLHCDQENITILFFEKEIFSDIKYEEVDGEIYGCLEFNEYSNFNFRTIGDIVIYNHKEYVIDEIIPLYEYISKQAMEMFISNPSSTIIRGPIENAIEQIKDILKKENDIKENILNSYDALAIKLPLSISAKRIFSSKLLDNLDYLFYGSNNKFRNNLLLLKNDISTFDKIILSIDVVYILYHIKMKKNIIIPDKFILPGQIKESLISEINDELRDVHHSEETGRIAFKDNGLKLFERDAQYRKNRYEYLNSFKLFIEQFPNEEKMDYSLSEIIGSGKSELCSIEKGVFGLYVNSENSIILTEDSFISSYCKYKNYNYSGVTNIIHMLCESSEEILEIVDILREMNFNNYFPLSTYLIVRTIEQRKLLNNFYKKDFENQELQNKHNVLLCVLWTDLRKYKLNDLTYDSELLEYLIEKMK